MWLKRTYFTAWAEFYWELYDKALPTMPSESYGRCAVLLDNSCEATRGLCFTIDYVVSNIIETIFLKDK
jgi:hypothetical protein